MHIDQPDNAASKALVCVRVSLQAGTEDNATVLEGSDWAEEELLIDRKPWEVEPGTGYSSVERFGLLESGFDIS
jgi:hypothetical protein